MRIFLFLMLLNLSSFAQQDIGSGHVDKIASMERDAHIRLVNGAANSLASNNINVKYYRCKWEVDPAVNYIRGEVTVYFVATASLSSVTLDLSTPLVTDSVKQRGNMLGFTRPANALQIDFPGSIVAGSLDSVSVYYQGIPPPTGFGSFILSNHAGVPVMWTLSEPYGARDWWPCKNGLDDKADSIDVFVTAPSIYKSASNGLLQSETPAAGGTKTIAHWKHRYPIATYLICFAVTNYSVFNNAVQIGSVNLPMQTYCYPEDIAAFQAGTQDVLNALQLFSNYFTEYPFINEKYGHVQFGWGGGMEHQTSTFITGVADWLTAHELGHQWFGDKITCASWEHIWLNEGFATYLSRFYLETKYPATIISNRRAIVDNITSQSFGSVKVDDTTSVGRIFDGRLSYDKGSYLLSMLRLKLGDTAFFNGIRNYQQDPSIKYGFAKTADLQRNLEAASGQDLTVFFDQWFEKQGFPTYRVLWSSIGSSSVKIKLMQTTSHASVSFFEMPVPLLFKNASQQVTVIVNNLFNGEEFIKNIGFTPDTVLIDPEYLMISKDNTAEKVPLTNTGMGAVEVYPNPIQGPLTVYLHDFNQPAADLMLYNMAGQLVYKRHVTLVNGAELLNLNLDHLSHGKYILKVICGNYKTSKSLLK